MALQAEEVRATLAICLLASFSDGEKHEREREQIRRVAEGLATDSTVDLAGLYQDVLLRRIHLADAIAAFKNDESRQLAYEMAVCVCEADGIVSEKEQAFLNILKQQLFTQKTHLVQAEQANHTARKFADAPVQTTQIELPVVMPEVPDTPPVVVANAENVPTRRASLLTEHEIDSKILKASIMNGAIELLPENLSTIAIIPLQMRLVYQIGQSYGYELDRGHIKDFLATLGVGLTSQYLEQAGRKLLGSLLGKGVLGGLGRQAVSSGMSFASTYALGHVANQYYSANRQLSKESLQQAYQRVTQEGRSLQRDYLPQIQQTASGLNTAKIMSLVGGR